MNARALNNLASDLGGILSRRATLRGVAAGSLVALLAGFNRALASGMSGAPTRQDAALAQDELPPGIAFIPLLSGGIVWDMPSGPVDVRITRFTAEPGSTLPAYATSYPALMYIESGTTACPGAAGRVVYGPDGTILDIAKEDGIQYSSAGETQYIPANVADGGGNEGTTLMSSIVIEFVPLEGDATPPAGIPVS